MNLISKNISSNYIAVFISSCNAQIKNAKTETVKFMVTVKCAKKDH